MARSFTSPQPNVPGQGVLAGYSLRFWGLVVAIGVATGLAGAAFIALLDLVQRLAWRRPASQFPGRRRDLRSAVAARRAACFRASFAARSRSSTRSEEHTSELQSL